MSAAAPAAGPDRRLQSLLSGFADVSADQDRRVRALVSDSRLAGPESLFAAFPGTRTDGRCFVEEAVRRGAIAIVYERSDAAASLPAAVPAFPVADLRRHLGTVAARFYGLPSRHLLVIGVTGTNGKTTCAHLTAQALQALGVRAGMIGTIGAGLVGRLQTQALTTPDAIGTHRLLAAMRAAGAEAVAMEVSSHGLDQGRVGGVEFDVAVFTNLSRDHLDYHADMEAYGESKSQLFRMPGLRHAVINADDDFGEALLARTPPAIRLGYGLTRGDVRADSVEVHARGLTLSVSTPAGPVAFESALIGRVNAYNLVAVVAVLYTLGRTRAEIARVMPELKPAPGRLEVFRRPGGAVAVVDYAHTPDALEQALRSLREHTSGTLWCVFGCGGDRDRGKRPLMGAVAGRLADRVILTDDNPRGEDGDRIVADIAKGLQTGPDTIIRDRREAILFALERASRGDLVLIAGKGHETSQTVGDRIVPLSDRAIASGWAGEAA